MQAVRTQLNELGSLHSKGCIVRLLLYPLSIVSIHVTPWHWTISRLLRCFTFKLFFCRADCSHAAIEWTSFLNVSAHDATFVRIRCNFVTSRLSRTSGCWRDEICVGVFVGYWGSVNTQISLYWCVWYVWIAYIWLLNESVKLHMKSYTWTAIHNLLINKLITSQKNMRAKWSIQFALLPILKKIALQYYFSIVHNLSYTFC